MCINMTILKTNWTTKKLTESNYSFHLMYDSIILLDANAETYWPLEIENVTQF